MAILTFPTHSAETGDGATVGCTSDDATGIIYMAVRTDRQWYSVANGDSQALADADKALIILQQTDTNIKFVATVDPAVTNPSVDVTGLADEGTEHFVGWVQDYSLVAQFYTDTAGFTYSRSGAIGVPANDQMVIRPADQSGHKFATWAVGYTNGAGLSHGIQLGGLVENKCRNASGFGQDWSLSANSSQVGSFQFGDVELLRYESANAAVANRRNNWLSPPIVIGELYTVAMLCKADEVDRIGVRIYDGAAQNRGIFDLTGGTWITTPNGVRYGQEDLGDGVWRIWFTTEAVATSDTGGSFSIAPYHYDNSAIPIGDGIYWGGIELVESAHRGNYVDTSTVALTSGASALHRSFNALVTNGGVYGQLVLRPEVASADIVSGQRLLTLQAGVSGSETDALVVGYGSAGTIELYQVVGSAVGTKCIVAKSWADLEELDVRYKHSPTYGLTLIVNGTLQNESGVTGGWSNALTSVSVMSGMASSVPTFNANGSVAALEINYGDVDDAVITPSGVTYYVSNAGDDVNDGLSPGQSLETIDAVNALSLGPGDSVLFNRGDRFYGMLVVDAQGSILNKITFGAYGTDPADPIIDRSVPFSDWSSYYDSGGTKIWQGSHPTGHPRGMIADGVRIPTVGWSNDPPEEFLVFDETFQHGGTDTFYYRSDAGTPVNTEVGIYETALHCDGAKHVVIEDLYVYGPAGALVSNDAVACIYIEPNCDSITVRNCEVTHSNAQGVVAMPESTNIDFVNLTCHNLGNTAIYNDATVGSVYGCTVYDIAQGAADSGDMGGIGSYKGSEMTIENNDISGIGHLSHTDNSDFPILINYPAGPCHVIGNYIHDVYGGGIGYHQGVDVVDTGPHTVAYNIIARFGTTDNTGVTSAYHAGIRVQRNYGVHIFNNVIADGGDAEASGGISVLYSSHNAIVKNNIMFNNIGLDIDLGTAASQPSNNLTVSNNLYFKSDYTDNWRADSVKYSSLATFQAATIYDDDSVEGDPIFVQTTPSVPADFQLDTGSPAIDAGVDVGLSKDFEGNPVPYNSIPDIGALEKQE